MSDADSLVNAITWLAIALGIGFLVGMGVIIYCCCFGGDEATDQVTLLDGLLRRDQLEATMLENGEDAGWQCIVCAYANSQGRKTCLMCGTSVGFLMSNRLVRLKSSGALLGNDEPNVLMEDDQRARQRALAKRRMNSMSLRKDLSQRQRGAIRRRLWERKLDGDGKFHWVRQNSTDNFNDTALSGNAIMLLGRGKVQQVNGPLESMADYHNLRSQGFVWQYDDLGRLTWKQAEDGAFACFYYGYIYSTVDVLRPNVWLAGYMCVCV